MGRLGTYSAALASPHVQALALTRSTSADIVPVTILDGHLILFVALRSGSWSRSLSRRQVHFRDSASEVRLLDRRTVH